MITSEVSRDQASFAYARTIEKPYGQLNDVLDWCRCECQSDWRWQMIELSSADRPGRYIFYFDDSRDCMAFSIKWA